jgi:hypothetical protein
MTGSSRRQNQDHAWLVAVQAHAIGIALL